MLKFYLHPPHSVWTLLACVMWTVLIYAVIIPVNVMNGVTNGIDSIAFIQILLGMNVSNAPANSSSKTVKSSWSMTVTKFTAPWRSNKCLQTTPHLIRLEQSHSTLFCSAHCLCQHMAWVSSVSSYFRILIHASVMEHLIHPFKYDLL